MKSDFKTLASRIREQLASNEPREERARAIADTIRGSGPYRWVGIYEITSEDVSLVAFSGPAQPAYPVFPRDKGLTGEMLRRGATVISGDVSADPHYLTAFPSTRSEMIVPVKSWGGEVIGTIDIESEVPNAFGTSERGIAEAVATVIEPLFWRSGKAAAFLGIDHIDTRVTDVAAVEAFYDELMPKLGLPRKRHAYVDAAGDWHDVAEDNPYNAVEYYENAATGSVPRFIGFIEDAEMRPTKTRIAFRISGPDALKPFAEYLAGIGAKNVELSADMESYPAVFFEDPAGTLLELCAKKPT